MIIRGALLVSLLVGITTCSQAFQNGLAGLKRDGAVGRFRVANLYSGTDGQIVGAKFWDSSGAPIYILQIETVPQVFMWVDTPAVSNEGLAHSLEHLLAGKGTKGRYISLLKEMRLSRSVAATTDDFNLYSFSSGTGLDGFFEQFHAWLDALFNPDFTDVEAQREFYHFAISLDPATKKRTLVEQGTVYNEMQSGQGMYTYYFELNKRVFGEENPFGFYGSGVPDEMRGVVPSEIRQFHREHYRLGPTTGFIFVLHPKDNALGFLHRISQEFANFGGSDINQQHARSSAMQPKYPVKPAANTEITLFPFPSRSEADRGEVRFGWRPIKVESQVDLKLLQLLLRAVGDGDKSLLYRFLIDSKTRDLDSGATNVESSVFLVNSPFFPAEFIGLSGIPGNKVSVERIQKLRDRIMAVIREISLYPNDSVNLAAFNRLVASYAKGWRRSQLVWAESAPRFGFNYDTQWKEYLEYLEMSPSFVQPISDDSVWGEIDRRMWSGKNIWTKIISDFRLLDVPYATASVPSPQLLADMEDGRQQRLAARLKQLMEQFETANAQQALSRFEEQEIIKTKQIDNIASEVHRPRFSDHPPLTPDDDIQYSNFHLAKVPVTAAFFERAPTIDLGLSFDIRTIPHKYYKYLPILPRCLDSLGLKVGNKITTYADLQAQIQEKLSDFSVHYDYNPVSHRTDLRIQASTTTPTEFRAALLLTRQITTSNHLDVSNAARLRDLVKKLRSEDDAFDNGENDFWFMNLSNAFWYEDDPLYVAVASIFTRRHWEGRLGWLLHDRVSPAEIAELRSFAEKFLSAASGMSAKQLLEKLSRSKAAGMEGELLEYWERNIPAFPENEVVSGLKHLALEVEEDLKRGPSRTIADLRELQKIVLDRKALRIDLTLSRATLAELRPDLLKFVRTIAQNGCLETKAGDMDSDSTPLMNHVWSRYKLEAGPHPWYVGFVDSRNGTANMAFYADFPGYAQHDRRSLVWALSSNLVSGSGPHSVYMKTEERGLAYASSISSDMSLRVLRFHAERSPDIVSLIELVNSTATAIPNLQDPSLVDNALQETFPLPRSMATFTERGRGIARDIRDGNDPEQVRQFSESVLRLRAEPNLLAELATMSVGSICPVLLRLDCTAKQKAARSLFFFTGPERLLADAENRLGLPKLFRVYPCDFWLDFSDSANTTSIPKKGQQSGRSARASY